MARRPELARSTALVLASILVVLVVLELGVRVARSWEYL